MWVGARHLLWILTSTVDLRQAKCPPYRVGLTGDASPYNANVRRSGGLFRHHLRVGGECLLGQVVDGEMQLNDWGRVAHHNWQRIPHHFG